MAMISRPQLFNSQLHQPTFKPPSSQSRLLPAHKQTLRESGFLGLPSHQLALHSDHMEGKSPKINTVDQSAVILAIHSTRLHISSMDSIFFLQLDRNHSLSAHPSIAILFLLSLLHHQLIASLLSISLLESFQGNTALAVEADQLPMEHHAFLHALLEPMLSLIRMEVLHAEYAQANQE